MATIASAPSKRSSECGQRQTAWSASNSRAPSQSRASIRSQKLRTRSTGSANGRLELGGQPLDHLVDLRPLRLPVGDETRQPALPGDQQTVADGGSLAR